MELELETVLKAKIEDYEEAETMLEDAAQVEDVDEGHGDTRANDARDRTQQRGTQAGRTTASESRQINKKVRVVPSAGEAQRVDGDRATAEREGINSGVPGKEQFKRAERGAKQARRLGT